MYFSEKKFKKQCDELIDDIENEQLSSPAWVWISMGALLGLIARCIRIIPKEGKPILANVRNPNNNTEE